MNDDLLHVLTSCINAGLHPLFPFDEYRFQYCAYYSIQKLTDFRNKVLLLRELGPLQLVFNVAKTTGSLKGPDQMGKGDAVLLSGCFSR
jgi:hypothetical protein